MLAAAKELRLTLRVRNNRLISAREQLGLKAREAAERIGVGYSSLLNLETLRLSPIGAKGSWSKLAARVAAFYGDAPGYYWPEAVMAVVEPVRTVEIDAMDAVRLTSPGAVMALPSDVDTEKELSTREEVGHVREDMSRILTARETEVVMRRFGLEDHEEETLDEIGQSFCLSRDRVRQIQEGALAKLRREWDRSERRRRAAAFARRGMALCPVCQTPFTLDTKPEHGTRNAEGDTSRTCSQRCAVQMVGYGERTLQSERDAIVARS